MLKTASFAKQLIDDAQRACGAAALCAALVVGTLAGPADRFAHGGTIVRFDTVMGSYDIQLFDEEMPNTVGNFLSYVEAGKYSGTVVHRNSDTQGRDFVIQGGGFTLIDPEPPAEIMSFENVETDPPIDDEPGGGVAGPSNTRGTIAMAKSGPNTVTSQWFVNQGDNSFLDSPTRGDGGFSAFGMVLGDGMDVVDAIGDLPLPNDFGFGIGSPFNDLPLRNFDGSSITDIRVEHTVTVNSVSVLDLLPGDFNRDGNVDADDLTILTGNWGISEGAFLDSGDADMDGDVDGADFAIWQRGFEGGSAGSASVGAVPEPSTVAMAAGVIAVALLATRRRKGAR